MRYLFFFFVLMFAIAACSDGGAAPSEPQAASPQAPPTAAPAAPAATTAPPPAEVPQAQMEPIEVVTTTNIVADWAQIVGRWVNVLSLFAGRQIPTPFRPELRK